MTRSLVSGGAGFIGSHLCERLLAEGHQVISVDNLLTGSESNLASYRANAAFSFVQHDITKPLYLDGPIDYVLHLASAASPVDYEKYGIKTLKANALGTHNMLGIAKAKGAHFLLASTSEVYGDPEVHPQPETYWGHVNPVGPRSVYDEGKRFAEALVTAYRREHHLPVGIVRIFNAYGPRMRLNDGRVIPNFMSQALRGEPLTVHGNGKQTRSFCYIDDLVEGMWRMLDRGIAGPVNLGNPDERTILEIARLVEKIVHKRLGIVFEPLPHDDPARRCPDITEARKLLGWEPKVALEEGLRKTYSYYKTLQKTSRARRPRTT